MNRLFLFNDEKGEMKKNPSSKSFAKLFPLLIALVLAGTAQYFLAQQDRTFTLWLGLAFYGLSLFFLFKFFPSGKVSEASPGLSPFQEGLFFFLILSLAAFFRLYKIQEVPDGFFSDRAFLAHGALRVLNEHWRPALDVFSLQVPELWAYYGLAGWFKLFGSSPDALIVFDVVLALAGLAFAYGFFRQLSNPQAALIGLFLMATMRWDFVFSRKLHFQEELFFFMFATLFFLFVGFRRKQRWAFLLSGAFLAAGLYSYQAFKIFPLYLMVCAGFEFFNHREEFRKNSKNFLALLIVFIALSAPLVFWMVQHESAGRRESVVSILPTVRYEGNLKPILRNVATAAQMFNRQGDTNSQFNFENRRMLDDLTGALFLLAFAWGISRLGQRPYFYSIAGIGIMSLPSIFSINGCHAGRMLGVTPFVAILCASFLLDIKGVVEGATGKDSWIRRVFPGALLCLLALVAAWNFRIYFSGQAKAPTYLSDFSWAETKAGQIAASEAADNEVFVALNFYGHPTLKYLTYPCRERVHLLDLAHPPGRKQIPVGKGICFLLDEWKMGSVEFLAKLYPGGRLESFTEPLGRLLLYVYRVPAGKLEREELGVLVRGLRGMYRHLDLEEEIPFLERWDPVINFTFLDLPRVSSPLFIRWKGRFQVPRSGSYGFLVVTYETDRAGLWIDGHSVLGLAPHPSATVGLKAGWHDLELVYRKQDEPVAAVNLLWKMPGQEKYEFIPNEAFGPLH
jgi:hypothetical protein